MDCYTTLGIAANASLQDIRKAYRTKAKTAHPDRCGDVGLEKMKEINQAYFILSHEERRREYDVERDDGLDFVKDAPRLRTTCGRAQSEKFREKFLHWHIAAPDHALASTFGTTVASYLRAPESEELWHMPLPEIPFMEVVLNNVRDIVRAETGRSGSEWVDKLWSDFRINPAPWRQRYGCDGYDAEGSECDSVEIGAGKVPTHLVGMALKNIADGFAAMALDNLGSMGLDRWDLHEIIAECVQQPGGMHLALDVWRRHMALCERKTFHLLLEVQDPRIQREVYRAMESQRLRPDMHTAELCQLARVAVELSDEIYHSDIAVGQQVPLVPLSPLCDREVLLRFCHFFDVGGDGVDCDEMCVRDLWSAVSPYIPWVRVCDRPTKMPPGRTNCAACNAPFRGATRRRCGACRELCCVSCASSHKVDEIPYWGILRKVDVCQNCDQDLKKRRCEGWRELAQHCTVPQAKLRMAFFAGDDNMLLQLTKGYESDGLRLLSCADTEDRVVVAEKLLQRMPHALEIARPCLTDAPGDGLAVRVREAFQRVDCDTCVELCEKMNVEAARALCGHRPDCGQRSAESTSLWRMIRGCALCVLGHAAGPIEVQRAAWSGYGNYAFRELAVGMRFHRSPPADDARPTQTETKREGAEKCAPAEAIPCSPKATAPGATANGAAVTVASESYAAPVQSPSADSSQAQGRVTSVAVGVADSDIAPPAQGPSTGPPVAVTEGVTGVDLVPPVHGPGASAGTQKHLLEKNSNCARVPEKFKPIAFVPAPRAKLPVARAGETATGGLPPSTASVPQNATRPKVHTAAKAKLGAPSRQEKASGINCAQKPANSRVQSHSTSRNQSMEASSRTTDHGNPRNPRELSGVATRAATLAPARETPRHHPRTAVARRNVSAGRGGAPTPSSCSRNSSFRGSSTDSVGAGCTDQPIGPVSGRRGTKERVRSRLPSGNTAHPCRSVSRDPESAKSNGKFPCVPLSCKPPPTTLRGASGLLVRNSSRETLDARPSRAVPVLETEARRRSARETAVSRTTPRRVKDTVGPIRTSSSDSLRDVNHQRGIRPSGRSTTVGARSLSRCSSASTLSCPCTPPALLRSSSHIALSPTGSSGPVPVEPAQHATAIRGSRAPRIGAGSSSAAINEPPIRTIVPPLAIPRVNPLPPPPAGTRAAGNERGPATQATPRTKATSSLRPAARAQASLSQTQPLPILYAKHPQTHQLPVAQRRSGAPPPKLTRGSGVQGASATPRLPQRAAQSTPRIRNAPLSARTAMPQSARSTTSTSTGRQVPMSARSSTRCASTPRVPGQDAGAKALRAARCDWLKEDIRVGSVVRVVNLAERVEYNDLVGVITCVEERITVDVGGELSVRVKRDNVESVEGIALWKKDAMAPPRLVDGDIARYWPSLSVPGTEFKALTRYETQIHKIFCDPSADAHDLALAYVDCAHFAEDFGAAPVVVAWTRAAQWFALEALLCKEAIEACLSNAFAAASSDVGLLSLVCRLGIGILARLGLQQADTSGDSPLAVELAKTYLIVHMMEAHSGPLNFALSESLVYHIMSRRMNTCYALGLQVHPGGVPRDIVWSCLWDSHFLRVCELENGERARVTALQRFVEAHGTSLARIEQVLHSPWIARTQGGWLQPQVCDLPPMPIRSLHGVTIAKGTQTVSLIFSANDSGFLSWKDVGHLFAMEADCLPLYFSLDPLAFPHRRCPLYGCDALPKSYAHSDAVRSIAHADWLLKQIALGSEVSCNEPFTSRPLKFEEQWLRPLPQRGSKLVGPHRFWLTCDTLEYKVVEKDDATTMHFGKATFAFRSHLKSLDGEEERGKDRIMEEFCRDLTAHWVELRGKFPIFRRVEEIAKLQFVAEFLRNYRDTYDPCRAAELAARVKAKQGSDGDANKLVSRIVTHFADQRVKITRELQRLKNIGGRCYRKSDGFDALKYMPAAFQLEPSRCYGGVLIYPKLKHCVSLVLPSNVETKRLSECLFASSCGSGTLGTSSDPRRKSETTWKDDVQLEDKDKASVTVVIPVDGAHSVNLPKGPLFQGHLKVKEAMQVAKLIAAKPQSATDATQCSPFLEATLRTKYLGATRNQAADFVAQRCGSGVRDVPSPPRGGR